MQTTVRDINLIYYAALAAQQMREFERAKMLYELVVKYEPKSEAAKLSAAAARALSGPAEVATLPRETWVPFTRMGSHILIDAELNGRPVKMIFDTGADFSFFSEQMLETVGMSIPDRPPDGMSGGVGKAGMQPMWKIPTTLKVGRIERKNFRVGATKIPQAVALLGRDFYSGFEYSINDANNTIGFKRIGSGSSTESAGASKTPKQAPLGPEGSTTVSANGTYVYNVPYTGNSSQIIVEAKLNGAPCKMIFDTGAGICFFTSDQAAKVGVFPPANAPVIAVAGVGGGSSAQMGSIGTFRLGTLELKDVPCAIGGKSVAPYPLLGQSFFRDFQYSVDSANKVIHLSKSK
ncbi:MAG: retropepsin-like domain-containing protein [Cyanobacteria bacterium SZAS-4]|nr:retropepsin-like domain-containing protein [Cyanobacteria bacterium SZAS-4]